MRLSPLLITAVLSFAISCASADGPVSEETLKPENDAASVEAASVDPKAETALAEQDSNAADSATDVDSKVSQSEVVAANTPTDTPLLSSTCSLGDDIRQLRIVKTEEKLCSLLYEKFGSAQEIAHAVHQGDFCAEVKGRVETNLQAAGFKCQGELSSVTSNSNVIEPDVATPNTEAPQSNPSN